MAKSSDITLQFGAGVVNRRAPTKLPPGAVVAADNVDIGEDGVVSRREGFSQVIALPGAHSLWSAKELMFGLVGDASTLYGVEGASSTTPLVNNITGAQIGYAVTPLGVYWSNGDQCGRIGYDMTAGPWGVETPPGFFLTAGFTGGLDAGTYGVSLAFASASSEEGGATSTQFVDVPQGGSIQVNGISAARNAETSEVRVYVTSANSTELFYAGAVPAGAVSYTVGASIRGRQLGRTQYCLPFPAVKFPLLRKGRLFGAIGNRLVWSEPMYYGLYNPAHNFVRLHAEPITTLAAPESQAFVFYIGTETHTYVLRGESIETASLTIASNVGVIPGSMAYLDPDILHEDTVTVPSPVWVDKRGVPMIGTEGGLVPLSDKFVYPIFDSAAAFFAQNDSSNRYFVAGRGGRASGMAMSDRVVARSYDMGGGP